MKRRTQAIAAAAVLLCITPAAAANPGVGLAIHTGLFFLFGNALIGLIEGLGAWRITKIRWFLAVPALCAVNYFSGYLGFLTLFDLHALIQSLGPDNDPLAAAYFASVAIAVLLYPITLIIEWPLFYAAARFLGRTTKPLKRSLIAAASLNAVTVGLTLPYFGLVTDYTLYTDFKDVTPEHILAYNGLDPSDATLLFIDEHNRIVAADLLASNRTVIDDQTNAADSTRLHLTGAWDDAIASPALLVGPEHHVRAFEVATRTNIHPAYDDDTDIEYERSNLREVSTAFQHATTHTPVRDPEDWTRHGYENTRWFQVAPANARWIPRRTTNWLPERRFRAVNTEFAYITHASFHDVINDNTFMRYHAIVLTDGLFLLQLGPYIPDYDPQRLNEHAEQCLLLIDFDRRERAYLTFGRSPILAHPATLAPQPSQPTDTP